MTDQDKPIPALLADDITNRTPTTPYRTAWGRAIDASWR